MFDMKVVGEVIVGLAIYDSFKKKPVTNEAVPDATKADKIIFFIVLAFIAAVAFSYSPIAVIAIAALIALGYAIYAAKILLDYISDIADNAFYKIGKRIGQLKKRFA